VLKDTWNAIFSGDRRRLVSDGQQLTTGRNLRPMAYAEAEKAAATRAAYASDRHQFAVWCHTTAARPLPAHQGIVAAYLSHLGDTGRKASTIGRKCAAITGQHRLAGHRPAAHRQRGGEGGATGYPPHHRHRQGGQDRRYGPHARRMLDAAGDRLIDARDRALLAFGMASAMRRSELATLDVADLTETPDGLHVLIRRSKTDQERQGQTIAVPRGEEARGPARPRSRRLRWPQPAQRLRNECGRGERSLDMLRVYSRRADLDHAGAGFL
jgi:hypothetical protein